jgi:hypothetical protein
VVGSPPSPLRAVLSPGLAVLAASPTLAVLALSPGLPVLAAPAFGPRPAPSAGWLLSTAPQNQHVPGAGARAGAGMAPEIVPGAAA